MVKLAVMGHGVVGSGVAEVFFNTRERLEKKAGHPMDIKYILDLRDFPGCGYEDKFIKDFQIIADDPEISVVVETMGGLEPAFTYVKACLERGKSVVTSNKELVAEKGALLLEIAREHKAHFFFEASVGGGIPIIRPLYQCLGSDEIHEIAGILNGTTNFILTKMFKEQMCFEDALALAQKLGYAERDPSADVDGHDSCRKICILASLSFGKHIYPKEVHTEGIRSITLEDVSYARGWGGEIKLIGRTKRTEDGIYMIVAPALVSGDCQLSTVDDVFNGILVRGDATGDVVFYGKGAGKYPTASAVLADIVNSVKQPAAGKTLHWVDDGQNHVMDYRRMPVSLYVRCLTEGCPQTLQGKQEVEKLFGNVRFLTREGQPDEEFAFITPVLEESEITNRLEALENQGPRIAGKIRVLDCG